MESRIILGIDQSLTGTGYVLMQRFKSGKYRILDYGIISTELNRSLSKIGSTMQRVRIIRGKLHTIAAQADEVWLESLSFSSTGNATRDLAMLFFAIADGYNAKWVAPTTIKKLATGKGNTKGKECMFLALPPAVRRVFGKFPKTKGRYDLSDAYWICKFAFQQYPQLQ